MNSRTRTRQTQRTTNRNTRRNIFGGRYTIYRDGTLMNSRGDELSPTYPDSKGHWSGSIRIYNEDGVRISTNIAALVSSAFGKRAVEELEASAS